MGARCGDFAATTFASPTFLVALISLFAMQFLGEAWLAGAIAALQGVGLRRHRRSAAIGAFYMLASFVGCANLIILGARVDTCGDSIVRLRTTMIEGVALPYVAATGKNFALYYLFNQNL